MGDIVDELGNYMPVPGNGRAKRARIDREGNLVSGGDVYAYNKLVVPPVRYKVNGEIIDSVLAYGAVADGTSPTPTDNTNAFQTALASNCSIFVPAGTYYFASTLTIPVGKILRGCGNTVLTFDNNAVNFVCVQMSGNAVLTTMAIAYTGTNTTTSVLINMPQQTSVIEDISSRSSERAAYGITITTTLNGGYNSIRTCFIYAIISGLVISGSAVRDATILGNVFVNDSTSPVVDIQATTDGSGCTFVSNTLVGAAGADGYNIEKPVQIFGGRSQVQGGGATIAGAAISTSIIIVDGIDKFLNLPAILPASSGAAWNNAGVVNIVP